MQLARAGKHSHLENDRREKQWKASAWRRRHT